MCIRDSAYHIQVTLQDNSPPVFEPRGGRFPDQHIAGIVNACLLYTSDAADERSSVDLGGRRIIKKKNQTTSGSIRDVRQRH